MNKHKTLKTGCLAYYDASVGLVPVKVRSVTAEKPDVPKGMPVFDLGHGNARVSLKVVAEVTEQHSPYQVGEIIESNSVRIVPRGAIIRRTYSMAVGIYDVVPDPDPAAGAALPLAAAAQ